MDHFLDKAKHFVKENLVDVKKPEAKVTEVDLAEVHRDRITYNATVAVENPYSHSIPVCQVTYTLKCGGRDMVSGEMPDAGSLPGHERTMLKVPLTIPHKALFSLVKDIRDDGDIDYELYLRLTIHLHVIGDFTIDLSHKGELRLPSLSHLWKK